MKKHILSFFLLIILLTGCSTNQAINNKTISNNTDKATNKVQTDIQEPKINNSQNINEKQKNAEASTSEKIIPSKQPDTSTETSKEMTTSEMINYTYKNYNFSVNYPKDWKPKEEKNNDGTFKIIFSNGKDNFIISPKGPVDYGFPIMGKEEKQAVINNKQAIRKEWRYDNEIMIVISFKDLPKTWANKDQIIISGQQNNIEIFEKMINSFKFVE